MYCVEVSSINIVWWMYLDIIRATKPFDFGVLLARGRSLTRRHSENRRAIGNVLDNALKYSPSGASVSFRCFRDGVLARIVVTGRDTGIGSFELPSIIDRFNRSRAERNTTGSGLGLPIVQSVLTAHVGSVVAEPEASGGTTVPMLLPISSGA